MSDAGVAASVAFDPRPLLAPVDHTAARAYARAVREANDMTPSGVSKTVLVYMGVVALFVLVVGFVTMAGSITAALAAGDGGAAAVLILLPLALAAVVVAFFALRARRILDGMSERWFRLGGFAQANGMTFRPRVLDPRLPGMIFSIGDERCAYDVVRRNQPRFLEFGNYQYLAGSGRTRIKQEWGYVAVKLDARLPHIVLDAVGPGPFFATNPPASPMPDRQAELGGGFDQHFSLACAQGRERDAQFIFTPDILTRFLDGRGVLSVEIVDDWLFLYGRRKFSTLDPATWAWLSSVIAALLDRTARWQQWQNESGDAAARTDAGAPGAPESPRRDLAEASSLAAAGASTDVLRPPPIIAFAGRRVARGVPWRSYAVIGVGLLIVILWQTGLLGSH